MNHLAIKLIMSISIVITSNHIQAFVSHQHTESLHIINPELKIKEKVIRPESVKPKVITEAMAIDGLEFLSDPNSGVIRVVWGNFNLGKIGPQAKARSYISLAKRFLNAHPELFGLSSVSIEEVKDSRFIGDDEQFFKFSARREGILIKDSNIDFRFKRGTLLQIINQSFSELVTPQGDEIEGAKLVEIIRENVDIHEVTEKDIYYRVVKFEGKDTLRKIKSFKVRGDKKESFIVEVDVHSGKIYEIRSEFHFNEGHATAEIYPRWFNQGLAAHPLKYLNITGKSEIIQTDLNGHFTAALDDNPQVISGLRGKYVSVFDKKGNSINQEAVLNEDIWALNIPKVGDADPWLDERIAQAMIYDKTTQIVEHALKYVDTPWLHEPLRANANLRNHCNAHWDGRTINLYTGDSRCANTGLIADVIYHEWGHGYDANTGGIQDGAFSEGIGDIMSLLMTRSSKLGIGFRLPNHEPVRDLEPNKIYPRDRGGVHAEGLIIGSTFWDLYKEMEKQHGGDKTIHILSNYVFKMIFTARTYLDVYQALIVIDDNDEDLTNGTPNLCLLNKIFAEHGLTQELNSCKLASVEQIQIEDTDNDGVIEPSETIAFKVSAKNSSSQSISGLTGRFTVEAEGIEVKSSELNWSDIPAGESLFSKLDAIVNIDDGVMCGSSFQAKIDLNASGRNVSMTKNFLVGRNRGTESEFAGEGLPLPIEDLQQTVVKIGVNGEDWDEELKVASAYLEIDITHTYVGDLKIFLSSPSGEQKEIYRGNGGGNDVHLKKDISRLVKGDKAMGDWSIMVSDSANRDEGSLDRVMLKITPAKFECN